MTKSRFTESQIVAILKEAGVAVTALKDDKTLAELAEKFDVHRSRITQWSRA